MPHRNSSNNAVVTDDDTAATEYSSTNDEKNASLTNDEKNSSFFCKILLQYHIQWNFGSGGMAGKKVMDALKASQDLHDPQILDHRISHSQGDCLEELYVKAKVAKSKDEKQQQQQQAHHGTNLITRVQTSLKQELENHYRKDTKVTVEEWVPRILQNPLRGRPRRIKSRSTPVGRGSNMFDDEVLETTSASSSSWGVPAQITVEGQVYHIRMARDSLHQLQQGHGPTDYHGYPIFRNGRRVFEILATHDDGATKQHELQRLFHAGLAMKES